MDEEERKKLIELLEYDKEDLAKIILDLARTNQIHERNQELFSQSYNEISFGDISIRSSNENIKEINKLIRPLIEKKHNFQKEVLRLDQRELHKKYIG